MFTFQKNVKERFTSLTMGLDAHGSVSDQDISSPTLTTPLFIDVKYPLVKRDVGERRTSDIPLSDIVS